MRRFKTSLLVRTTSRALIMALVWNFVLLGLSTQSAEAQFRAAARQWAVLDFANRSPLGGPELGGVATDAVTTMLLGTNRFDILPRETVERIYRELELSPPVTRELDILRVGQALGVETVITGEITQARINRNARGKSADVVLVVRGIDIASGLPVMGVAVPGQSSERPGDVPDDVLLNEAINYAAQQAVNRLLAQQVDVATVLTTPTTQFVQLNKGTRQGMRVGMQMVVTRGAEQVATIRISDVSTEMSTARILTSSKGVAPGDRARAIFPVTDQVVLTSQGPRERSPRRGDATGAILALLVVGGLTLLVAKGGGTGPGRLVTEAWVGPDGFTPVVRATWSPNIFSGGLNRVEWHLWRLDYNLTPVEIIPGHLSTVLDFPAPRIRLWRNMGTIVGGTECIDDPGQEEFPVAAPGIQPGTTHMYQISLVYFVTGLDIPGAGAGDLCFFQSGRQTAEGQVTPLVPPEPSVPPNASSDVGNIVQFTFSSSPGADQYAVQLSRNPSFTRGNVMTVATVETTLQGGISTDPVNISGVFPGSQRLYWRVGSRNSADVPGPVPDPATGQRYVFGRLLGVHVFQFDRVTLPPPPPGNPGLVRGGGK